MIGPLVTLPSSELGHWATLLVCAYFIGHLIFLVGSYIDGFYNTIRQRLNPHGHESAYQCATRIRDSLVDETERQTLNTFQWARAVLITKSPAAAEDVHRVEADSKFFRSLLVMCALAALAFFTSGRGTEGLAALGLMLPCFARYYERRLKRPTQAYIDIIAMQRLASVGGAQASPNKQPIRSRRRQSAADTRQRTAS